LRDDLKRTLETVLAEADDFTDLRWPYETYVGETSTISSLLATENPRDIVIEGTLTAKRIVARAFGPAGTGRSVSLGHREPLTYREGLSILPGVRSANALKDRGIGEMKLVAQDILRYVGDGSKTAVLLAQAMLEYGNDSLKRGYLPRDVVRGMETAVALAL